MLFKEYLNSNINFSRAWDLLNSYRVEQKTRKNWILSILAVICKNDNDASYTFEYTYDWNNYYITFIYHQLFSKFLNFELLYNDESTDNFIASIISKYAINLYIMRQIFKEKFTPYLSELENNTEVKNNSNSNNDVSYSGYDVTGDYQKNKQTLESSQTVKNTFKVQPNFNNILTILNLKLDDYLTPMVEELKTLFITIY